MKYICLNEGCGKLFMHPAKHSVNLSGLTTETHVCPYCGSLDIEEYTEQPTQTETANVYVYELTSGAQTGLDNLLVAGYKIVARYSKQYHLEKPKEAKA